MSTPVVHLSRHYTFAATHRLYADDLSPQENQRIFGKCANPNGHGHNYGLTVSVAGPVDATTGMVMGIEELDALVRRHVLDVYDHRHLNRDVEDYLSLVPTGENIALRIHQRLAGPLGGMLRQVIVDETRNNRFVHPVPIAP